MDQHKKFDLKIGILKVFYCPSLILLKLLVENCHLKVGLLPKFGIVEVSSFFTNRDVHKSARVEFVSNLDST